jgi:hypothetical protein
LSSIFSTALLCFLLLFVSSALPSLPVHILFLLLLISSSSLLSSSVYGFFSAFFFLFSVVCLRHSVFFSMLPDLLAALRPLSFASASSSLFSSLFRPTPSFSSCCVFCLHFTSASLLSSPISVSTCLFLFFPLCFGLCLRPVLSSSMLSPLVFFLFSLSPHLSLPPLFSVNLLTILLFVSSPLLLLSV